MLMLIVSFAHISDIPEIANILADSVYSNKKNFILITYENYKLK